MDPDFSLVLAGKEEPEYFGVAWLNDTAFGKSIKVNVQCDISPGTELRLVPRKGFEFAPARTSDKNPDLNVKLGRTNEWVGKGWINKNKYGGFEIKLSVSETIPETTVLFVNPVKESEGILL